MTPMNHKSHTDTKRMRIDFRTTSELALLIAMLVALAIFYRASYQVPITALGLAIFGILALWRPDLGLLFAPLTAPLYFMPKGIWDERFGIRPEGIRFPLHEVVLLVVLAATVVHATMWWMRGRRRRNVERQPSAITWLTRSAFVPIALFLVAGTIGVLIAPPEGRGAALREWRWLIVEPVLFYGLLRYFAVIEHRQAEQPGAALGASFALAIQGVQMRSLFAFILGGAFVGLVGVLQFAGLNLAPLIGDKVGFSDDQIVVEGVRRVTGVYGHPNNLGLYMGRVWPVAAALGVGFWQFAASRRQETDNVTQSLVWAGACALCALLALGGLAASFSKGALLGAGAAFVTLLVLPNRRMSARFWRLAGVGVGLALILAILAALGVLGDIERFNPLGETSAIRLKTWTSALAMLRDHPLAGIGLDQFGRLYPQYIDPTLANTNEINTAHPHNLLLDITLQMGWLGLLAFGWLVGRFFRQWGIGDRKAPTTNAPAAPIAFVRAGLIAAMVAALAHGLVDSFYFWPDLAFGFWLLLGIDAGRLRLQ